MSGMMEILLIAAIVLGVFLLPRLRPQKPERDLQLLNYSLKFTGWMRFAILASILWPALIALFLKPWNNNWPPFLYVALGPLAVIWGARWVLSGFIKEKK